MLNKRIAKRCPFQSEWPNTKKAQFCLHAVVVLAKRLQGLSPPDVKYMYKCTSCIFKIMQPLSGGDPQSTRTLAQRCVGRKL